GGWWNRADLGKARQEHVLQTLLGIAGIARDAEGEPVEPGRIALHEAFERSRVARLQALHEPKLDVAVHGRVASCHVPSWAWRNGEQLTTSTPARMSRRNSSTPARSMKVTSVSSSVSLAPVASA